MMDSFRQYNFSSAQRLQFSSQFLALLTNLTFFSGADELEDKYYIGINATAASLNALPSSVGSIAEIPGYRLSISCQAAAPVGLSMKTRPDGNVELFLSTESESLNGPLFTAAWTGSLQAAFGVGSAATYLLLPRSSQMSKLDLDSIWDF